MKNALILALERAPQKRESYADEDQAEDDEDDADELSVSKEQVAAAKACRRASSDEDYARALLAFLKLSEKKS